MLGHGGRGLYLTGTSFRAMSEVVVCKCRAVFAVCCDLWSARDEIRALVALSTFFTEKISALHPLGPKFCL